MARVCGCRVGRAVVVQRLQWTGMTGVCRWVDIRTGTDDMAAVCAGGVAGVALTVADLLLRIEHRGAAAVVTACIDRLKEETAAAGGTHGAELWDRAAPLKGGAVGQTVCAKYGAGCLGKIQLFPLQDKSKRTIVNIFGENIPTEHQCDTDYVALKNGLLAIARIAYQEKKAVAIPGMIGCGLAGGDWQFVYKSILLPIFENRLVDLFIFWLNEDLNEKGNELIRYTDPNPIIF